MEKADITFRTRKWVRPEDLNANGTLFGGSLLKWIDEEAAIYAILQLGNGRAVTKYISEINFVSSAVQGDLVEMGLTAKRFGRTSLTMRAEVRNMITRQAILTIEEIVFVNLGRRWPPAAARLHGDYVRPRPHPHAPPDGNAGRGLNHPASCVPSLTACSQPVNQRNVGKQPAAQPAG